MMTRSQKMLKLANVPEEAVIAIQGPSVTQKNGTPKECCSTANIINPKELFVKVDHYMPEETDQTLCIPKYESTKGTTSYERDVALQCWDNLSLISEDKTSVSEYIPTSGSDSSGIKKNKPENEWWMTEDIIPTSEDKVNKWLNEVGSNDTKINSIKKIKVDKKKKEIYITQDINKEDKKKKERNITQDINKEDKKKKEINIIQDINVADYIKTQYKLDLINNPSNSNIPLFNNDIIENGSTDIVKKEKRKHTSDIDRNENKLSNGILIHEAGKQNGRRIRNKVHSCYFCMNTVINMARHFENVHKDEITVARILARDKCSVDRKNGFLEIIRAGDFNHNCEVMTIKEGELILVRRPTEAESRGLSYEDYGPCPHCLGFMLKKHLWHHVKHCSSKSGEKILNNNNQNVVAESEALLNQVSGGKFSTSFMFNIVSKMRSDEIGKICREDQLILKFGAMLYEKYHTTQRELIRQSMRQLGRLVLTLQECVNGNVSLVEILKPETFDVVVEATKMLCVNQVSMHKRPEFDVPSLALKIGYALKKCASIERGSALRKMDLQQDKILKSFLNLMELEWSIRISSNALSTMYKRKMNKTQLLPLTSDLVALNKSIMENIADKQKNLEKSCTLENWQSLAYYTLGRIILFNKRRSGEVAKMTIENYHSKPAWSEQSTEEIKNSLTSLERKLTEKLTLVEIEGKRGRKVAVLLTEETKCSIEMLIKYRIECNINSENPYIFAAGKNSNSHLRGHDCLSKICQNTELQNPENIKSTKLRKYIATVCQIFNLSENDYDWLARHLGHDIRVHREFYRLHDSAIELTKVSRLLLAVDSGQACQFAGKTLAEINVDDLELDVDAKDGNDDNDDEEEAIASDENLPTFNRENPTQENRDKNIRMKQNKLKSNKTVKTVPWTKEEREAVLKYFRVNIKIGIVPGKKDCEKCKEENKVLERRDWKKIKFCVKNQITKIKKKAKN